MPGIIDKSGVEQPGTMSRWIWFVGLWAASAAATAGVAYALRWLLLG
jgi:hypothetical protein